MGGKNAEYACSRVKLPPRIRPRITQPTLEAWANVCARLHTAGLATNRVGRCARVFSV